MSPGSFVPIKNSIATHLLKVVFAFYIVIAVAVTCVHMYTEYQYQKNSILRNLHNIQKTFETVLAGDIWHMDYESMQSTVSGILEIPEIVGVKVQDINGKYIAIGGVLPQNGDVLHVAQHVDLLGFDQNEIAVYEKEPDITFEHQFPITYTYKGNTKRVGTAFLFSSTSVVFQRVKVGYVMLIVNAVIKTIALWIIFLLFSNILLRRPLSVLAAATKNIHLKNLHSITVDIKAPERNELKVLEESFNAMIGNLKQSIDERKQAQKDLVRLSTAIEQAHEAIVVTDSDAHIQYVNPAFESITGYTRDEATGKNPNMLQSGKHDAHFYIDMWHRLSEGNTWQGHFINKKKDGSIYHEEATISPVKDPSGNIINYVAVKRDITRELQKERQLERSQKMEAIGTLAGGIAHDFNNILAAIMGYTELSIDDVEDRPGTRKSLQHVLEASYRARDLVGQILTFSRATEVQKQPVKTTPIVKEVCKFMRSSLPATIRIKQHITAENDFVMADPTRFHQILMNLCTNAGHAMKKTGGELEIALEEVQLDQDDLHIYPALQPGPFLKLSVKDTGYGITKDNLERIFEPYFTTKDMGEGTGLGLAVVHGIVKDCGGEIKVYSEIGKGTAFHVLLPLIKRVAEVDLPASTVPLPTGTEKLMFVDDEEALVGVGKRMLERLGYTVVGFSNPVEALDAFMRSKQAYDLIVTDETMPKMRGYDLAVQMKKIRSDIPILICSGYKDTDLEDRMQDKGIAEFVMKPLTLQKIAHVVRTLLDGKEN